MPVTTIIIYVEQYSQTIRKIPSFYQVDMLIQFIDHQFFLL